MALYCCSSETGLLAQARFLAWERVHRCSQREGVNQVKHFREKLLQVLRVLEAFGPYVLRDTASSRSIVYSKHSSLYAPRDTASSRRILRLVLRGTIVNGTYGIRKNLYI